MLPSAIKGVLVKNRLILAGAVKELRQPDIDIYELTLQIEKVIASLDTMESLISSKETSSESKQKILATDYSVPTPAFVAEVEDDNPEKEDADVKKAREQSRGFFG